MDLEHLPEEALVDIKKTQKVIKQIPPAAIRECEGLAIFTIMRTGFMVSGASGSGIVISRLPDGCKSIFFLVFVEERSSIAANYILFY